MRPSRDRAADSPRLEQGAMNLAQATRRLVQDYRRKTIGERRKFAAHANYSRSPRQRADRGRTIGRSSTKMQRLSRIVTQFLAVLSPTSPTATCNTLCEAWPIPCRIRPFEY